MGQKNEVHVLKKLRERNMNWNKWVMQEFHQIEMTLETFGDT